MDTDKLQAERAELWAELMRNGGRGIETAERIDEIDALLGADDAYTDGQQEA